MEEYEFSPPRLAGYLYLAALISVIIAVNLINLLFIAFAPLEANIILHLIFALIAPLPLPWFIIHLRSLARSRYILERDGVRLQWGARQVDLPMNSILWMRLEEDDPARLVRPRLQLHGALLGLGKRILPSGDEAEIPVEFMASRGSPIVLIATAERVYAISPQQAFTFVQIFLRLTEYGSLNPIPYRSIQPSLFPKGIFQAKGIRTYLIAILLLNILFFSVVWVITSPAWSAFSQLQERVGITAKLWLLPFLNLGMSIATWVLAITLYRTEKRRPLAYLLWSNNIVATFLLMGAVYVLLQNQ